MDAQMTTHARPDRAYGNIVRPMKRPADSPDENFFLHSRTIHRWFYDVGNNPINYTDPFLCRDGEEQHAATGNGFVRRLNQRI